MKIAICQLITPNIDAFAKYSSASILAYCKKHHYSYFIQRDKLIDNLHINWTKIRLVEQLLDKGYDYVTLIDADILLTDINRSVESFIKDDQVVITMVEDTHLFIKSRPNAGFILIKNNHDGKKLIKMWLDAAYSDTVLADKHPRNQRIYWKYVQPFYREKQHLIPYKYISKYFFWFNKFLKGGKFAYHFDQTNNKVRSMYMGKEYYRMQYSEIELGTTKEVLSQKKGLVEVLS
ncbi:Nucleotide-diphospho-sugar transferase [Ekhidna lutea]|uniref:Nucleotide-diphospho-sugar transferase n=1 Tax=Ekhidna lutea TaxID=447679 RepID=A0A239FR52_EKHLU|nr:putative nucleotide-diphospho-sugar transferase [Ekhidna lutea]SNS59381.1 Nucleotide-diphospho-sugar transferase [Ekhidna lutea]